MRPALSTTIRVAIGRAIVREPDLFLFDEPLSNLDAELRVQMRVELVGLYNRLGTTMIYVTHDQVEAMTMATRIVVLNAGRIEQVGTPYELYTRTCNRFVAAFNGSPRMNLLAATGGRLTDFSAVETYGAASVGIRSEQLEIVPEGPGAEGTVTLVEYLGSEVFVHLALASGQPVLIKAAGKSSHRIGDRLRVGFAPADAHYFDADGSRLPVFDQP
jgi:ABC-type sugar transport system ATPase subunit